MTEAEQVMKRCQIGTRNYNKANNLHADCYRVIGKLLAEKSMREVQRLGQEIEQEPVAWPCLIDSADFSENTITLVMQCEDYKVTAGPHWLSTTPPKENT